VRQVTVRVYRRPLFWWCSAAVFAVVAAFALVFAVSGASLAFVPCDNTYSLSSDIPRCRWPAIWALLFNITLGAAFICAVVAVWHHWRSAKGRRSIGKAHT
jgi:hypothetical protein